jgi:hypothetical protein
VIELIEKDGVDTQKATSAMPGNLQMHVDIYKHHWDLFLKGFAAYLAACAIFASFAIGAKDAPPNIFQKLFAGGAVIGASIVAVIGLAISLQFLKQITATIDVLCVRYNYEKISFWGPKNIVQLFCCTAVLLLLIGVLYVIHLFVFDRAWEQIQQASAVRAR